MNFEEIDFLNKRVPKLIFGTLTMAPLQRNMPPEEGGKIIAHGIDLGLRWIDTAQMYGSYKHTRLGIEYSKIDRDKLVISTKSAVKSFNEMSDAINQALSELNTDYIDLFLLHAVRSIDDFKERAGAFEALLDAQKKGIIHSVGISTHSTVCARILATDKRINWFHLMFNKKGIGITDGTIEYQEETVKIIKENGGRVYAMKPLGGGYLKDSAEESLKWVKNHKLIDAVALGMTSIDELEMNTNIFKNLEVAKDLSDKLKSIKKTLFVFKNLCIGCNKCTEICEQNAINVKSDKKAEVDKQNCILCGYCVPVCPKFALRII